MADGEGAAAEPRDVAFDNQLLAMLGGATEGALGLHQRRAFLPLAAAHVVALQPGRQEQPIGRLVAPAEIGRVVDDAGRIAVAPLDGDLVTATQRHGAATPSWPRSRPASSTATRLRDRQGPRPLHWPRHR